jgi:hypothetical protein
MIVGTLIALSFIIIPNATKKSLLLKRETGIVRDATKIFVECDYRFIFHFTIEEHTGTTNVTTF